MTLRKKNPSDNLTTHPRGELARKIRLDGSTASPERPARLLTGYTVCSSLGSQGLLPRRISSCAFITGLDLRRTTLPATDIRSRLRVWCAAGRTVLKLVLCPFSGGGSACVIRAAVHGLRWRAMNRSDQIGSQRKTPNLAIRGFQRAIEGTLGSQACE